MIIDELDDFLEHYGTKRHSGRYPWGSGDNGYQRRKDFLEEISALERQGMSAVDIAKGFDINTTLLREYKSLAKDHIKQQDRATAEKLKATGMSTSAIGREMKINESSVRQLLKPAAADKSAILHQTAEAVKAAVPDKGAVDIGRGVENHLGVSKEKLNTAVAMLENEGYQVRYLKTKQLGTGNETNVKILMHPDASFPDVAKRPGDVASIARFSDDGGRSYTKIQPPVSVPSKRIGVRYADQGGTDKDGTIELRRGVKDLSLGSANYAQVRIMVDGTHYLKGMAHYSDNMPDGVDILFNTNKKNTGNKLDAMKPIQDDPDLPFGSIVRQKYYTDASGKQKLSPLNIVGTRKLDSNGADISTKGEEGGWYEWSKSLSSQFLSKQNPALAKQQLGLAYDAKAADFEEIMRLTNPVVRKKLLDSFSDGADSSAVHLKAAGLPRTRNHVILPVPSMKPDEVYAPQYKNGERVVLVRHPHGGIFEIPELTVNNRNREANRLFKNAIDAIGIHPKVASQLSGADFDGDTVLVIPNPIGSKNRIKTAPPLAGLKDFDSKKYKFADPDGADKARVMKDKSLQKQMGVISNLITDMTIKGASNDELERAVKHSMVVIDAVKHKLDYKQSEVDNNIAQLKGKYQRSERGGADTIISKAKSDANVLERKPRPASEGGPVNKVTGRKEYVLTGNSYVDKHGKTVMKTIKSTKMAEAEDARSLVSKANTTMENIYADHANKLKALANKARLASLETESVKRNPTAAKAYAPEVESLRRKINAAKLNAPIERKAQLTANAIVNAKKAARPDLTKDQIKKLESNALAEARVRFGAKKVLVDITDHEWEAIQAGAVTNNMLKDVLENADLDRVKQLATPRESKQMPPARVTRAKGLLNAGYTYAEVADMLDVPTSTLHDALQ